MPTEFEQAMSRLRGESPKKRHLPIDHFTYKIKSCPNCHITFKTHNLYKIYCSPSCQVIANNKNQKIQKALIKKNCLFCGKVFETNKIVQKFCPGKPFSYCQRTYQYHKTHA